MSEQQTAENDRPNAAAAAKRTWRGIRCAHESCTPYGICPIGVPYPAERNAHTESVPQPADEAWDCPAHSGTLIAVGVRGNRVLLGLPPQPCTCPTPPASTEDDR